MTNFLSEEEWHHQILTYAALMGFDGGSYHDYGHPERATARMYWTTRTTQGRNLTAYNQPQLALRWLRIEHNTNITRSGQVTYWSIKVGTRVEVLSTDKY